MIFTALRSFLIELFPDIEVRQAQQNNVPMPTGDFILMTEISRTRLATNHRSYTEDTQTIKTPTEIVIQLDFYGGEATERVQKFVSLFFDDYAYTRFPDGIKPLYATDPKQMPLITAEANFLKRWITEAHLQFNPSFDNPMETFEVITTTSIPV